MSRLHCHRTGCFHTLSAADQQFIIDGLAIPGSFFRSRQGRENLLMDTLRLVLVHWLEEKWALYDETQ
ncbi:MAG: hypothetical protein EOP86_16975 [Verrucomicrobiaceae bacterium]|nr:MAG: hypothetical protein EOP86_16975 [Verrucomicrobiaceae bacterium]